MPSSRSLSRLRTQLKLHAAKPITTQNYSKINTNLSTYEDYLTQPKNPKNYEYYIELNELVDQIEPKMAAFENSI